MDRQTYRQSDGHYHDYKAHLANYLPASRHYEVDKDKPIESVPLFYIPYPLDI